MTSTSFHIPLVFARWASKGLIYVLCLILFLLSVGYYFLSLPLLITADRNLHIDKQGAVWQGEKKLGYLHLENGLQQVQLQVHTPAHAETLDNGYLLVLPKIGQVGQLRMNSFSEQISNSVSLSLVNERMVQLVPKKLPKEDLDIVMEISLPGDSTNLPWLVRIMSFIGTLSSFSWFLLGLLLLLSVYGYYSSRHFPYKKNDAQKGSLKGEKISIAHAAVLLHGRLFPQDIVALLFNLAERGYLSLIVWDEHTVLFTRKRPDEVDLSIFERHFLNLVVPPNSPPSSVRAVVKAMTKHTFSHRVGKLYAVLFTELFKAGLTEANIRILRLYYKTGAILVQVQAIVALTLLYWLYRLSQPGMLWFFVAVYIVGILRYRLASQYLLLTKKGEQQITELYSLRHRLFSKEPKQPTDFYALLPYAIVLNHRLLPLFTAYFGKSVPVPLWSIQSGKITTNPKKLIVVLRNLTTQIGKAFIQVKDPNVE